MNNLNHKLIHVSSWTPDIRSEVPECPTPVIERYVVRAIIECCERARIWRWNAPEIPVYKDKTLYEIETPSTEACIHSIISVELGGRRIRDNSEDNGSRGQERFYSTQYGSPAYHIPDRGFIELTRKPLTNSRPLEVIIPPEPTPGAAPYHLAVGLNPGFLNLNLSDFPAEIVYMLNDGQPTRVEATLGSNDVSEAVVNLNANTNGEILLTLENNNENLRVEYTGGDESVTKIEVLTTVFPFGGNLAVAFNFGDGSEIVERTAAVVPSTEPVETTPGLELCVSIKPERGALEVSEVIYKDYYELVTKGALYMLMNMQNQVWSDSAKSSSYEKDFEILLNRARQQIDRGFITKSQRIRPRKFI